MRCRVSVLWVLIVAIAFVGAAQMSGCSKASQPYQSGKLYFSQKLYQKAAEQFQLAVSEDPETGKNYLELAKCYAELDENEKAGQNFILATEKDPTLKKEVGEAIQHYRAAHYNHAVELMKEKSYGDAISELQEAAYLDPSDPNQYINMGVCYSELKQPDLAVKFYEKALALSPEDKMARENLIGTFANQAGEFRRQKSYDEAIKFYKKVLELSSGQESLDVDAISAPDLVTMFKDIDKGTGYIFDLGIAYLDQAEDNKDQDALERASAIFKALYDANPADEDALYYYAYSRSVAEDYSDAIMSFGRLLDRNPREASYYMDMASAYVKAAGSDSDMQMKGVLYFALAKALGSDSNKLAKSAFKDTGTLEKRLKEKYKTWSDMKKALGSMGLPEDIYAYTEDSGNEVEAWMYWSKGEAAVFTNGYETGKISFAPQE
jgi:tetratricopeptide (TPR) repeat protein